MPESRDAIARGTVGSRYVIAALVLAVAGVAVLRVITTSRGERARLVAAAAVLPDRAIEGRLSGGFSHRPFAPVERSLRDAVEPRYEQLYAVSADMRRRSTPRAVQTLAATQLLLGRFTTAVTLLSNRATSITGKSNLSDALRTCVDNTLLTDLSAAQLEAYRRTGDPRALLMAIESSTEAVARKATAEALWNRALAIERLGIRDQVIAAWNAYFQVERDRAWADEGRQRLAVWRRHARVDADSLRQSFERSVIATAQAPASQAAALLRAAETKSLSSDPFVSDVAAAVIGGLNDAEIGGSIRQGLVAYSRGLQATEDEDIEVAASAFGEADHRLTAARNPFALAAAYQRMRAVCNQGSDECDPAIQSLGGRLRRLGGRYESLMANVALARGRRLLSRQRSFEALQAYKEALAVFERIHDGTSASWTHTLVADVLAGSGETDAALVHHLRALSAVVPDGIHRRQQLEDAAFLLIRMNALATASTVLDSLRSMPGSAVARAAESALQASLALRRGRREAAMAEIARAEVFLQGVPENATAWIRPYLEVVRVAMLRDDEQMLAPQRFADRAAKGDLLWQSEIAFQRGLIHQKQRQLREAEADFREAIRLIEQRAPSVSEMVIGAGLLAAGASPFDALVTLLLDQKRFSEALASAERSNALHVSELYGNSEGLANPYSVDASGTHDDAGVPKVLIVEYVALPRELVTFAVRGTAIDVRRHAIERTQLMNEIRGFVDCVRESCPDDALVGRLSGLLVGEAIEAARENEPVIFIVPPDWGVLPFAALTDKSGLPLLDRHAVAVADSIAGLGRARAIDADRTSAVPALFVAASNPRPPLAALPGADAEMTGASVYCDGVVLTGRDATRTNFVAKAKAAAVIHFAGHALVDRQQPLRSALVFNQSAEETGDLLYVHEVTRDLFSNTRLAVLAACETGTAPRPGVSIAAALRARGTPSVVYTLWPVEDTATAAFSIAFHRRIAAGQARVTAIAEAQRELRRSAPRAQWAAFQLNGALGSLTKGDKVCN